MKEIRERESKLIEKSMKAIRLCVGSLAEGKVDEAISMYNTVLKGFESLQKIYDLYDGKDMSIPDKLAELERNHKLVIQEFEQGNWESLIEKIESAVYDKYKELQQLTRDLNFYEKIGVNTKGEYFKMFKEAGLLKNINQQNTGSIQQYWKKHYGKTIDPSLHIAYENLAGKSDSRVVPQLEVRQHIIPYLNSMEMLHFYNDKNVYDLLITSEFHPEIVLKRVNGQYFDLENNTISRGRAFKTIFETREDIVVKRSLSDDGKGVGKLKFSNGGHYFGKEKFSLKDIEKVWGENFSIQKVIKQHPILAAPHKYSINTLRMVTLRWNDEIHYLTTYVRFGVDKSMKDNGGNGGIAVGVKDDGEFQPFAMDRNAKIYETHPTTGFKFVELDPIPEFSKFISFVKKLHKRILHHNFVSWDIAVGENGEPVFIEMNFWGAVWRYQLANKRPIFGEFTEEIMEAVKKDRENRMKHGD
ncbi:sugar-transfer associated ATP-grasp domain-containing protein [Texcoconibacillus texcoconensis]|uniref:Alpha-L-glutamate ligase-related protein ATP-grasp domain-containing protein n=1 Tax=Texcoconibacillus texcoconensis TaxID=1095777 RepID=A0A840QV32_9BACI|nr:sugar-transfer associated ATP-grasp domain-containing protein [Texcoconibacillus texcoconensis]MBB5175129.1 hypothetical protein [Texcoconibacillus texcoconensis]